ncbi:hypothetical protein WDV93_21995 [Pantoea ananatis]
MDPLDGSSNIDVNVSVGTIFSIYRRVSEPGTHSCRSRLHAARQQTGCRRLRRLWLIHHDGVHHRLWRPCVYHDPSLGVFCLSHERMTYPEVGYTYSINEGNYIRFPQGVKST